MAPCLSQVLAEGMVAADEGCASHTAPLREQVGTIYEDWLVAGG